MAARITEAWFSNSNHSLICRLTTAIGPRAAYLCIRMQWCVIHRTIKVCCPCSRLYLQLRKQVYKVRMGVSPLWSGVSHNIFQGTEKAIKSFCIIKNAGRFLLPYAIINAQRLIWMCISWYLTECLGLLIKRNGAEPAVPLPVLPVAILMYRATIGAWFWKKGLSLCQFVTTCNHKILVFPKLDWLDWVSLGQTWLKEHS